MITGKCSLLHHAALNDFAELTGWLISHGAEMEQFTESVNGKCIISTRILGRSVSTGMR